MIAIAEQTPCEVCGTTRGQYVGGSYRRLDSRKYGGPAVTCRRCHQRYYRKAGPPKAPPPPEPVVRPGACSPLPPPCSICGTLGGRPRRLRGRPIRYSGPRAGLPGGLCHACVVADPVLTRLIFRPPRRDAAEPDPDRAAVRRRALLIQSEHAREGDRAEARRLEAVDRGPGTSARAGAAAALREFRATCFGPLAFPDRRPRQESTR